MRKGFVCAAAVDAGAEGFLCRSSQPTKAWCKVSRMAKVPCVPSGEKEKGRFPYLVHRVTSLFHLPTTAQPCPLSSFLTPRLVVLN